MHSPRVQAVDFPAFVAGLIEGVFDAIVGASIKQMEAYAELVASVAKSVDHFIKDNVSDDEARDYLTDNYPDLVEPDQGGADAKEAPCHRQLLASMIAVGIKQIVGDTTTFTAR